MAYSVFKQGVQSHLTQPMFLGDPVSVARFDQQKFPVFEKLTERALSIYWRPEEVDISQDRADYYRLNEAGMHIFNSNIKYQTLLDSVQGRSPVVALLPLVSLPELENWIETWSFYETIHSRSYTHILRTIFDNPSEVLDDITVNPEILSRASAVSKAYDDLIKLTQEYHLGLREKTDIKRSLVECMLAINALEGVRFYVSFACSFAYAERGQMEGNAKIIRLIADDEAMHLTGTQTILNLWRTGQDDKDMEVIMRNSGDYIRDLFGAVAQQEKDWAGYLFGKGSMIGLNESILSEYVEYITDQRIQAIGTAPLFGARQKNPIPWIADYLSSNQLQVAPQETEITSYMVSQVDMNVPVGAFNHYRNRVLAGI